MNAMTVVNRLLEMESDPDSPDEFFSHAASKLLKPGDEVTLTGRRWLHRTYGNTYCTTYISINGQDVGQTPIETGQNDMWMRYGMNWLLDHGYITWDQRKEAAREMVERMGFTLHRNVYDIKRERDL